MERTEVHKFGGTSVAGAERMRAVAALVKEASRSARVVVVSSAMAGVTDGLLDAAARAATGSGSAQALEIAEGLIGRHVDVLAELAGGRPQGPAWRSIQDLGEGLKATLRAVAALQELTGSAHDRIVSAGERLAIRLLAYAIEDAVGRAVAMDADEFFETDGRFGEASPLARVGEHTIRGALLPGLAKGEIPVVTGFVGRGPEGATTTLGRGGSDLSATVIAAALKADEVTIWTDVDGVFSADPRTVPEARRITQLNYREATELSYYGAKVLHQRTIIPVAAQGIPVRIRSSLDPSLPGTVVDGRFTPGSHPVKAISAVKGQALVSVEGKGMAGVPGVAARVFRALAERGISVTMISQSSSESSITLVVAARHALETEMALKREFRADMTHGEVEEVMVREGVGLVAAVGLGMAHVPGVAGRVLGSLGRRGINVLAIAQGSSELNISVAVDASDVDDAVRGIHQAFSLHGLDTGSDDADALDLLLVGAGQIGRALASLVLDRQADLFRRFGLKARIVAICDRSGFLCKPPGISHDELSSALHIKAKGRGLASVAGGTVAAHPVDMVRTALGYRLVRPVLVDVSDAEDSDVTFREAMRLGCDVVTANKKPLGDAFETYRGLMEYATERGRILRAEATVGAGLPVVDTLEMLLATGDRLVSAEGCLSGTLGFLMTRLEEGGSFSEVVGEAARLGYTEPDPVVDLSGVDVSRKAIILGRLAGLIGEDAALNLEGLVEPTRANGSFAALLERLKAHDEPLAARVREARREGQVLRYVARVARGRVDVALRAVDAVSPMGTLKGSDNLILFRSERYHARPLVIMGPGAGVEVTTMGVLGDIVRVAAERR
jgi:aspartokinase/homoserine dehydrogenase 1